MPDACPACAVRQRRLRHPPRRESSGSIVPTPRRRDDAAAAGTAALPNFDGIGFNTRAANNRTENFLLYQNVIGVKKSIRLPTG
jgi:hypothetical protein